MFFFLFLKKIFSYLFLIPSSLNILSILKLKINILNKIKEKIYIIHTQNIYFDSVFLE